MNDRELTAAMLLDADKRAYARNIPDSSRFLSMDEQNIYHSLNSSASFKSQVHFLDGGYEEADRAAAFFLPDYADKDTEISEVITSLRITPVNRHFAEELSHRDVLGALMNLGIERDTVGDILIGENECFIFVLNSVAEVIKNELFRIKHTSVSCEISSTRVPGISQKFEELSVNIASERTDAVIAAVFKVSRQKAAQLIDNDLTVVSGRQSVNSSKCLKAGDRVSVRGLGKFVYCGVNGSSKRGRLFADIKKYV